MPRCHAGERTLQVSSAQATCVRTYSASALLISVWYPMLRRLASFRKRAKTSGSRRIAIHKSPLHRPRCGNYGRFGAYTGYPLFFRDRAPLPARPFHHINTPVTAWLASTSDASAQRICVGSP